MRVPTRSNRAIPVLAALATVVAVLAGCSREQPPLEYADLSAEETRYVTRFLVLERARAVSFVDRTTGEALLDSLAAAWGDTSAAAVRSLLPADPPRLAAVHELLERMLQAEFDSLLTAGRPGRLSAPLPELAPPEAAPVGDQVETIPATP